eukprot:1321886-Rhodomonas_salina.2
MRGDRRDEEERQGLRPRPAGGGGFGSTSDFGGSRFSQLEHHAVGSERLRVVLQSLSLNLRGSLPSTVQCPALPPIASYYHRQTVRPRPQPSFTLSLLLSLVSVRQTATAPANTPSTSSDAAPHVAGQHLT